MASVEAQQEESQSSIISDHVFSTDFQETFSKYWHACSSDFKDTNLEITSKPFKICRISNFFKSKEFIENVKNELSNIKFIRNVIDLYQYEQSLDLSVAKQHHIKKLYQTFQKDLTSWLELNTKISLNETVSMSSSAYHDTDYLLCHADNLDDRRIAFILYLTNEWSIEDGGTLDLFDTDNHGLPRNVVKSIIPEYNSFVFFEVMNNSYHQVAEVISSKRYRWSINGWFHGIIKGSDKLKRPLPIVHWIEPICTEVTLESWISRKYLSSNIAVDIQKGFELNSYTFLQNFLKQDIYKKILIDLTSEDIGWKMVGPADERHYEIADEQTLPQLLKDFCNVFKSISFFQLLKNFTELDLVPTQETMKPKMTIELQRWSTGCYTLLNDHEIRKKISHPIEESMSDALSQFSNMDENDGSHENDATSREIMIKSILTVMENKRIVNEIARNIPRLIEPSKNDNTDNDKINIKRDAISSNSKDDSADGKISNTNVPIPSQSDNAKDDERSIEDVAISSNSQNDAPRDINKADKCEVQNNPKRKLDSQSEIQVKTMKTEDSHSPQSTKKSSENESSSSHFSEYLPRSESNKKEECASPSSESGTLDFIMQFHTDNIRDLEDTIDYLDPQEADGELAHVPAKENYAFIAYRTSNTCRLHRYINHHCKGYFYNLICMYHE